MQTISGHHASFIFLGMPVTFSIRVLEGLLAAGERPSAVWIADNETIPGAGIRKLQPQISRSELPLLTPYHQQGITQLAWENGVPVFAVRDFGSSDAMEALASLQVDTGIISCFSKRLPVDILAIPRSGFLNLHPSLLPAYKGPFPLFWTFRDGLRQSGVTLHHVDSGLDTGDIALQSRVTIPDGLSAKEADELFAANGTVLILEALSSLVQENLPRHPQEAEGSYFGRPSAEDFIIPTDWSARRAFNFMRGTAEWRMPYRIMGDGFELLARSALAFDSAGMMDSLIVRQDNESWIKFAAGILRVRDWQS